MRIKGLTRKFSGSRATNTPGPAPLCPKRRPPQPQPPFSMLFTEVVCDLGTLPSRTVTSPPPNGGICTIRGATRRRHAEGRLLMVQNPHRCGGCWRGRRAWLRGTWAAGHVGCGTRGWHRHHRQIDFARNLSRSFFEMPQKRCNSNGANSMFE